MRAVSLFSGVGGFEIGLQRAGIETVLQVESDPWCLSVLRRHWPGVLKLDDVREMDAGTLSRRCRDVDGERCVTDTQRLRDGRDEVNGIDLGPDSISPRCRRGSQGQDSVDLVYGGFPCQDVSVAGQRAGLGGERSGLWFAFHRVLSELRPRWALIENVPGLLSSAGGRDFGTILGGLDELGFDVAWAVLDAQHFGVPQRRRRVFIVAGPDRRACEQVLGLCESCGGHPQKGSQAGERVAASLRSRSANAGVHPPGRGGEDDVNLIAVQESQTGVRMYETAGTVRSDAPGHQAGGTLVARSLTSRNTRIDGDSETFLVASAVQAREGHHGHSSPRGDGSDNLIPVQYPQQQGRDKRQNGMGVGDVGDPSYTLDGTNPHGIADLSGVRRLTPLECERLQGWPDNWTRWTDDGREIPDSHRYRMIGNGVASPVAEWIGWRLVHVDRMLSGGW